MKRDQGFTLIELVVVVVLLGILAATALPRFVDLSSNARAAANQGIASAFQSGINLARSTRDINAPGQASLTNFASGGYSIFFNGSDWPTGATDGVSTSTVTVPTASYCFKLFSAVLANGPSVAPAASSALSTFTSTTSTADYLAVAYSEGGVNGGPVCAYVRTDGSATHGVISYDMSSGNVVVGMRELTSTDVIKNPTAEEEQTEN